MHAYIGFTREKELRLSKEVDRAEWVPESEAPAQMFPDRPGNTQHVLYRQYLKLKGMSADGK